MSDIIDTVNDLQEFSGNHFIHLNVRSIREKKIDELKLRFTGTDMDIITISESWLKSDDCDVLYSIGGYQMYRLDRAWKDNINDFDIKVGGGLCTYVNDKYLSSNDELSQYNLSNCNIEIQCITYKNNSGKRYIICNVYRPPRGDMDIFIDTIEDIVGEVMKSKSENVYFLGDFNIDLLDSTLKIYSDRLIDMMLQSGLMNFIKQPTRFGDKDSCLDLIFTNDSFVTNSGCIHFDLSDHEMVYLTSEIKNECNTEFTFRGRSMKNFDVLKLEENLHATDWSEFYKENCVDIQWEIYYTKLLNVMDEMCPYRNFTVKRPREEWVTDDLLAEIADKDRLLARSRKTKNANDKQIAIDTRKRVSISIKSTREKHVNSLAEENKNNPQIFRRELSKLLPGNKAKKTIIELTSDDELPVPVEQTAKFINEYFSGIGEKLAKNLSDEWSFDGDIFEGEEIKLLHTGVAEVEEIIKNINITKSSSIEGLSSKILKLAFGYTKDQMVHMFNCSLDSGKIPKVWKNAMVIPIHKGGDKRKVNNLRPISLLPLPGKMLERIIHTQLSNFLENNNLLSNFQFGYRKNCSTIEAIGILTDDILGQRNVAINTMATFFDLKKAFDTVDHSILLKKLSLMGIKDKFLNWILNYLSDRTQLTFVNGVSSNRVEINCGVPQGSILGPLLFLVYINDIEKICDHSKILLFADDTVLYTSNRDDVVAMKNMQIDVDNLVAWCRKNKLTVNTDKTKFMGFGNKKSFKNAKLFIGTSPLKKVPVYKYLGVHLDSKLNYECFMKNQMRTVAFRTYQLTKLKRFLSSECLLRIYKAYILPILDYGDILYHTANVKYPNKLQRSQNKALKICLKQNMRTHTVNIHNDANINYLVHRRYSHACIEGYKRSKKVRYRKIAKVNTRLNNGPTLVNKLPHTEAYKKSVEYYVSVIWNSLDAELRNIPSIHQFKQRLKNEMKLLIPDKIVD